MKNLLLITAAAVMIATPAAAFDLNLGGSSSESSTNLHSFSGMQGNFGSISSTGAANLGLSGAVGHTSFGFTSNAGATANLGECGCDVGVHTYGNAFGVGGSFGVSGGIGFAYGQNESGFSGEFQSFGEGTLDGEFSQSGFGF